MKKVIFASDLEVDLGSHDHEEAMEQGLIAQSPSPLPSSSSGPQPDDLTLSDLEDVEDMEEEADDLITPLKSGGIPLQRLGRSKKQKHKKTRRVLGGWPRRRASNQPMTCWSVMCPLVVVLVIVSLLVVGGLLYMRKYADNAQTKLTSQSPRNIILMIADGFGPASETMARQFYQHQVPQQPSNFTLPLDSMLIGSIRTASASSLVTDSAASATAYACGLKTYNGAIGVKSSGSPCRTIMEQAHADGYLTALVVTSRITHATPAAFASHVASRHLEQSIADQLISNQTAIVDLMMGGGRCSFLPKEQEGSCRMDSKNWLEDLGREDSEWTLLLSRADFDAFASTLKNNSLSSSSKTKVLALFSLDHMPYDLDRDQTEQPSLAEMTLQALTWLQLQLQKDSTKKGFLLMIEGSRVDMAAHTNDAAAHVHDILAYQDAVQVSRFFVDQYPGTLLLSTSDHETGGAALAAVNDYKWNPQELSFVRHSSEYVAVRLVQDYQQLLQTPRTPANEMEGRKWLADRLVADFGLQPSPELQTNTTQQDNQRAVGLTVSDVNRLLQLLHKVYAQLKLNDSKQTDKEEQSHQPFNPLATSSLLVPLAYELSQLTSAAAEVGWRSHGHSAVDVLLYGYTGAPRVVDGSPFPLLSRSFAGANHLVGLKLDQKEGWPEGTRLSTFGDVDTVLKTMRGNHDNTDVAQWVASYLQLSMVFGKDWN